MGVVAVDDVADGGGMEGVVMVMDVLSILWVSIDGGFDETALAMWPVTLETKAKRRWTLLMAVVSQDAPRQ